MTNTIDLINLESFLPMRSSYIFNIVTEVPRNETIINKIGKLTGSLAMKNGILEITQFKFGEEASSDFKGNISGEFKLEKIFEQSTFNVALKLKLSQKILDNPDAKTFTSFLSSYQLAPGEYGLKWNASVKDFTNFSIKAIPEKLNN